MGNVRSASKAAATGTSVTVAPPAGTQPADVLLAVHFTTSDYEGVANPAGWGAPVATIDDNLFGDIWARIYRRTAGAVPATWAFPQSGGAGVVLIVAAQDIDVSRPARIAVARGVESSAAVTTPSVNPAAAEHVEIRFAAVALGASATATLGTPSGYTPRAAQAIASGISAAVVSRQISSSSPSGAKLHTITGDTLGVTNGITISLAAGTVEPDVPPIPADAPGAGDALYRYDFSRLLDGARLGTLDLHGVSFEKRISRRGQVNVGNFEATYPIANEDEGDLVAQIIPRHPSDLLRGPGVTIVDIWRAGDDPWGRYWIVGAKITKKRRQRPVLSLSGVTMEAYTQYVELEQTLGPFDDEDRVEIVRQLIAHMQDQDHADIGLIVAPGSAGSTLTRTYLPNQGKYGQYLGDATAGTDGIEFMVNSVLGAEGVELHLVHGSPLGDVDAEHMFTDSPGGGEILDYEIDMTPLTHATRWRARGETVDTDASTTSEPLLSAAYSSPHLATGVWPRIDRTVDRPGVTDVGQLNAVAQELAATSGGAPHVVSITVLLGEQPTIHPSKLGDSARIVITDEWLKRNSGGAGLNERRRVIGMKVTPTGRENGRDEAELFIDDQAVE